MTRLPKRRSGCGIVAIFLIFLCIGAAWSVYQELTFERTCHARYGHLVQYICVSPDGRIIG